MVRPLRALQMLGFHKLNTEGDGYLRKPEFSSAALAQPSASSPSNPKQGASGRLGFRQQHSKQLAGPVILHFDSSIIWCLRFF
jgi:hypothetical protein